MRKSTIDAVFSLRPLMENYGGQEELHYVFVTIEKVHDKVPREGLWYCMKKSGSMAEKYVTVLQDMYGDTKTAVRCAMGVVDEFKVDGITSGSLHGIIFGVFY